MPQNIQTLLRSENSNYNQEERDRRLYGRSKTYIAMVVS